ncbi:Na+/H+ antiporter subunit A [Nocardioides sp. Y6]|uniref:Na+/H+ antiporter subunit A n=1 Tax=Nocardioides malaquae TaxID=2773426 RepID=A0ABR9RX73_9ACTN|nr:Na+/H+ antiporter subunit A [Nocardioides malaquae]
MLLVIAALFALAAISPWMLLRWGRRAFLPVAAVPLAATVWLATFTPSVVDGQVHTEVVSWVPSIGLGLSFALGPLQLLLGLIVLGIGAVVLAYCTWYFHDDSAGVPRFGGVLVAFVAAMLGLVLADDLLLMYVFWELTTVFSFLLVGHDPTRRTSRQAAIQALIVTTLGGLAMLVGALALAHEAGTMRISEILAAPPEGTLVTVSVLLLLVGAISKSALFPFHFWLPAAMAAPTPVSAYLHAASMVKAGVYLVALLAPAFADVPGWRGVLVGLGLLTMVLGGLRALRQHDLKLLLAFGTVSQLGFMMLVLGLGTRSAMLAGLGLVLAHALFKATLFLVVGLIDRTTGTRDLRKLTGLSRRMPWVAAASVLAALSMAGIPPLLGYVAKESVFVALVDVAEYGDGTGLDGPAGWLLLAGVLLGSILTVAYSLRFVWGAFADREVAEELRDVDVPAGFAAGPLLLGVLGLAAGFAGPTLTTAFAPHVESLPEGVHHAELSLWHGVGLPLLATGVAIALGVVLFLLRRPVATLQGALALDLSMERGYRAGMRGLDRFAVELTAVVQRGSAAAYLAIILVVVVVVPGSTLFLTFDSIRVKAWDTPFQALVGAVIMLAAFMATRSRRRLRAVLLAGATGFGAAVLFVMHGAPDLALTQVLVETLTVVVFVLALRRMPEYFTDRPLSARRYWRMALAVAVALAAAGFILVGASARIHTPVSLDLPRLAVEYGGGYNIVNVVLVDTRAWDTLGEIAVLVAAGTGVASLIFLDVRGAGIRRVHEIPFPEGVKKHATDAGRRVWLPAPRTLAPEKRSIIFEVITRLLFHSIIVLSLYLLFAGHNAPGGGFAGGLTAGLALVIRYLAGGRYELDEAAPVDAGKLIGAGLALAALAALLPVAFGGTILESAILDVEVPVLGNVHLVSSALFDIGVYLVVLGLVLDLLRGLGSQIDRQVMREKRDAEAAESQTTEAVAR